ncbi:MAG: hypothetical protein A2289_06920 [Deltaproteobacteria bacterium RIFOXYA12_FULL_58_15]|nr:MAG: hypothetical protein A2289_06920 [Deltaproteobacteria bacterium RIFOXYA12_FULL_58_15]OGR14403.1 MAG: hypothetical protein A2341_04610 [Deltaproteobacteria bacterium RIFOXYB12_FULL_58_9]
MVAMVHGIGHPMPPQTPIASGSRHQWRVGLLDRPSKQVAQRVVVIKAEAAAVADHDGVTLGIGLSNASLRSNI